MDNNAWLQSNDSAELTKLPPEIERLGWLGILILFLMTFLLIALTAYTIHTHEPQQGSAAEEHR